MTQQHHQNHATWECKYHVVFIPKYRKKTIFGVIKKVWATCYDGGERKRSVWATCSMNWRGGAKARSKKAI